MLYPLQVPFPLLESLHHPEATVHLLPFILQGSDMASSRRHSLPAQLSLFYGPPPCISTVKATSVCFLFACTLICLPMRLSSLKAKIYFHTYFLLTEYRKKRLFLASFPTSYSCPTSSSEMLAHFCWFGDSASPKYYPRPPPSLKILWGVFLQDHPKSTSIIIIIFINHGRKWS